MGYDVNKARAVHFTRMQQALEEGLKAIEVARSPRRRTPPASAPSAAWRN